MKGWRHVESHRGIIAELPSEADRQGHTAGSHFLKCNKIGTRSPSDKSIMGVDVISDAKLPSFCNKEIFQHF